jgi:hypothetical protein
MVSLGAKANLKKPGPESGRKTRAAGCLSDGGLPDSSGCRHRRSTGQKIPFTGGDRIAPVEKKRQLVVQWIARYWIQPIGKR